MTGGIFEHVLSDLTLRFLGLFKIQDPNRFLAISGLSDNKLERPPV